MASKIRNVVETTFTSKGAARVEKETQSIGRAQTRLGQESASAGRQFAAQSTGLGGLVAAYAGAAATIFALGAAFEALNRAAAVENAVKSTNALAAAVGQAGPAILADIQKITQGQLTLEQSTQSLNIALSTGFSADQIRGLTQAGAQAAQALGRDLNDSVKRVFKGAAELNTAVLKQVGIFVRVDTAAAKYAASIGKSASQLTEFERRQALVNAITEQASSKYNALASDAGTAQVVLAKLQAQLKDLGIGFLQFVARNLAPFVSFLSNNTGTTLLAFGALLSLVFGKATQIVSAFTASSLTNLADFSNSIANSVKLDPSVFKKLQEDVTKIGQGISFKFKGQDPIQLETFKDAVELQRAGQVKTIAGLNEVNEAYKKQLKFLEDTGRRGSATYKNLSVLVKDNNAILDTQNFKLRTSVIITNALKSAVDRLKFAVQVFGKIVRTAFFVVGAIQLAGSLLNIDFLGAITNKIKGITQATKDAADGFRGLTAAALGGGAALTAELKLSGFTDEQISKIPEKVKTAIDNARAVLQKSQLRAAEAADSAIGSTPTTIVLDARISTDDLIKQLEDDLNNLKLRPSIDRDIELEKATEIAITKLRTFGQGFGLIIAQISRQTGVAAEDIAALFKQDQVNKFGKELKDTGNLIEIFGIKINKATGLAGATADQRAYINALSTAFNTLEKTEESYRNNIASAESLGQAIVGINDQIRIARSIDPNSPYLVELNNRLDDLRDKQKVLENITDTISKLESTFGADVKILDTALWSGLVSASGKFAANQQEIAENQLDILTASLKEFEVDKARQTSLQASITSLESIVTLNASQLAQLNQEKEELADILGKSEAYEKTLEAIAGQLFKAGVAATQLLNEQVKLLAAKEEELKLLNQQIALDQQRLQIQLDAAIAQNVLAVKENDLKISRALLSTDEKRLDLIKSQADAAVNLAQARGKTGGAEAAARIAEIIQEVDVVIGSITSDSIRKAAAEYKTAIQTASTASASTIRQAQEEVLRAEEAVKRAVIKEQLRLFDAESRLLFEKTTAQIEALRDEANLLRAQAALDEARLEGQKALIAAELAATKAQIEAFKVFVAGVNGLGAATTELARVFNDFLVAKSLPGIAVRQIDPVTISTTLDTASAFADTAAQTSKDIIDAQISAIKKNLDTNIKIITQKIAAVLIEERASGEIRAAERAALELELAAASAEASNAIADLATKTGGAAGKLSEDAERIKQALLSIFDGLNSAIETSLIEVKNLILFGEGNLQDIFVKLLRSIGDTILEEGFIKPISERLTQSLFAGLTGIQGGRSGIEEAFKLRGSSPANPVFVSTGQGPLGGLLTPRQDEDAAGVGGFLQNIGNSIKNIFGNLFGADGVITKLISGFGNIVGSVFTGILKFITGIFGFGAASGGPVHRAAGGAIPQFASGGGLRDRVPALLEPGEFVLRRAAANKIGISNLQQMNATGQTPSGAPIINFTNEGTAKSVESSEPRFDGERYVIDIVTRDLQNNGPIRRSLRSGL